MEIDRINHHIQNVFEGTQSKTIIGNTEISIAANDDGKSNYKST